MDVKACNYNVLCFLAQYVRQADLRANASDSNAYHKVVGAQVKIKQSIANSYIRLTSLN